MQVPVIMHFLQIVLGKREDDAQAEMANLQALIILYIFTRSSVMDSSSTTSDMGGINFWLIKATAEAYALQIGLHRIVDKVKQQLCSAGSLKRLDNCVRKYLCWLWLHNLSHQSASLAQESLRFVD
jgi:hypothetical protein